MDLPPKDFPVSSIQASQPIDTNTMEEDEATRYWRHEAWINRYILNNKTVLDYFKYSDSYDRSCNNEQVLMQQLDPSTLKKMTGVEYEVDDSNQPNDDYYLLIRKQYRYPREDHSHPNVDSEINGIHDLRETEAKVMSLYYVAGVEGLTTVDVQRGTVCPLPDLHSVLRYNMNTSLYYLRDAMKDMADSVVFSPSQQYQWDFSGQHEFNAQDDSSVKESKSHKSHLNQSEDRGPVKSAGLPSCSSTTPTIQRTAHSDIVDHVFDILSGS